LWLRIVVSVVFPISVSKSPADPAGLFVTRKQASPNV